MVKHLKFEKDENHDWYVVLPEWEGEKSALQMVMGADDMLDILAQGEFEVNLIISTEVIDNPTIELTFLREENDGGWYSVKHSTISYVVLMVITKLEKLIMKTSEMHKGLDKSEIRDVLSNTLRETYCEQSNNKGKEIPYDTENVLQWVIATEEEKIKVARKTIKIINKRIGIIEMIKHFGWSEWDISEYATNDSGDLWNSFIGTEEEFDNLVKSISNE